VSLRVGVLAALALACAPKSTLPEPPALPPQAVAKATATPAQILEEAAGSEDPTLRGHALAHLVTLDPPPGAPDWAQRGLWDPEPWVEDQVVAALAGRLHEPESVKVLADFVHRDDLDPYVRATAALALRGKGPPAVGKTLSAAWRAEPALWKRAPLALAALEWGDRDAAKPLEEALARGAVAFEVDFLVQIGNSGHPELVPALAKGTEVAEPELRMAYAAARVGLGDASASSELKHALGSDDPDESLAVLDYLVRLHGTPVLDLLHHARGESGAVHWYATLALIGRGEGDATALLAAMAEPDREVRELAMRFAADLAGKTLSRKEDKAVRAAVKKGLTDEDPTVRLTAADAVSALGVRDETPWLKALLADDYPGVRVAAAAALSGASR